MALNSSTASDSSSPKKRRNYSNNDRLALILQIEAGKSASQLAQEEKIPKSTVFTWLKDKDKIKQSVKNGQMKTKKMRTTKNDRVDNPPSTAHLW